MISIEQQREMHRKMWESLGYTNKEDGVYWRFEDFEKLALFMEENSHPKEI